jgi:hypothetical protein
MAEMNLPASFKAALQDAKKSLAETVEARDRHVKEAAEADTQIVQLRRTIVSLSVLCNEPTELESMGITESIRNVMKTVPNALSVQGVKAHLAAHGFDLTSQKHADAAITTVLNRLVEAKEIRKGEANISGKVVATYAGPKVK